MRILILAQKNIYSDIVIQKLLAMPEQNIAGLVFSSVLLNGQSPWQSLQIVLKQCGWGVSIGKLINMIFAQAPRRTYPVAVLKTRDINSAESLERIRELNPDLILSVFFNQVLHDAILKIPALGAVNIHPAYLPQYRGVGPTFWALANGEKELGVTYHYMTDQVDAGDIIHREKVEIRERDSVHSLYVRCARKAAEMLPPALKIIEEKRGKPVAQDAAQASYYGLPDKQGYLRLRQRGKHFMTFQDIKETLRK